MTCITQLGDGTPRPDAPSRPYTAELVGWFNDFGTSGINDANGGIGRISTTYNTFSPSAPATPGSPIAALAALPGATGNDRRCPGSNERDPGDHSTPFTDNGTLDCDPSQVPLGP